MKGIIKKILWRFGYELKKVGGSRIQTKQELNQWFKIFLKLFFFINKDVFILNIGSHDGKSGDPFYEFFNKGILLEPQKSVFAKLSEHYKGKDVKLINSAIDFNAGTKEFYSVKEEFINDTNFNLMTQISSFDKITFIKNLKKRFPKNTDNYYKVEDINTISMEDLTKEVVRIDVLQVDCEGFDCEVIKMFDFKKFKPKLINFESKHLSKEDMEICKQILITNGYETFEHGSDTCGIII